MLHIESIEWIYKSGRGHKSTADARHIEMRDLFVSGKTLKEIGDMQNPPITRERVRQLLKKHFNITREDGGNFVSSTPRIIQKAIDKKIKREKSKQEKIFKTFGCSYEIFLELNGEPWNRKKGTRAYYYYNQWHNAVHSRGIAWEITFPEWCKVWDDSGKYHLRGRGEGYCMTRIGDTGGYKVGNVEIKTIGENFSESYFKHPWEERFGKRKKEKVKKNKRTKATDSHCCNGHEFINGTFRITNGRKVCRICDREKKKIKYDLLRKENNELS